MIRNTERKRRGPIIELHSPYLTSQSARYQTHVVPQAHVRSVFNGDTEQFLRLVANATGISISRMQSRCRDRDIVSARRTAVLAWRKLNRQTSEIAASLSIGVAAATHLAKRNADQDIVAERNAVRLITLCNNEAKNSA